MPSPIELSVTTVPSNTVIAAACLLGHTLWHLHLLLLSIPHPLPHSPLLHPDSLHSLIILVNDFGNQKEEAIDSA